MYRLRFSRFVCFAGLILAWAIQEPGQAQPSIDSLPARFIVLPPYQLSVQSGAQLRLKVVAEGAPPLTFRWTHNGAPVGSADSVLTVTVADQSHAGTYTCSVSNGFGSDTTLPCSVVVTTPLEAVFAASPTSGNAPLSVQFTDLSTGSPTAHTWSFGDGTTSPLQNPIHVFTMPGVYTVRLNVTGGGGTNELIRDSLINVLPAQVRAGFAASPLSGRAPLTVFFQDSSNGNVDGRQWKFGDGSTSRDTSPTHTYESPGVYTVSLHVQGIGAVDSITRAAYIRVVPSTDPEPPDTFLPGPPLEIHNSLRVSARQVGDTVQLSIDSLSKIDSSLVASAVVWVGRNLDPPFRNGYTKTIMVSELLGAGPASTFRVDIVDTALTARRDTAKAAVVLVAADTIYSDTVFTVFVVSPPIPTNSIIAHINAVTQTSAELTWTGSGGADSIRVWYSTEPLADAPVLSSRSKAVTASASQVPKVTLAGLSPATRYYFGIEVSRRGVWSGLVAAARGTAQTLTVPIDTQPVTSLLHISSLSFDSSTNSFNVVVATDSTIFDRYKSLVVTCAPLHSAGTHFFRTQTRPISFPEQTIRIDLENYVLFETPYTITAMLVDTEGSPDPSTAVVDTLTTGPASWQKILYFDTTQATDSVWALNGRVRLRKDSSYRLGITIDTLDLIDTLPQVVGSIRLGRGVVFRNPQPSPAFFVGLHIDSLPRGYSISSARIFRDSSGVLFAEPATIVDSASSTLWVKTNSLELPFYTLIDTTPPSVTILSDTSGSAQPGLALNDTVVITDNVARLQWSFLYAKGGSAPNSHEGDSGVIESTSDTIVLKISEARMISPESGLRALLYVNDGTSLRQYDLSRSALRQSSDEIATESMRWTPLRVTAHLYKTAAESALAGLGSDGVFTYDNRQTRIFRWDPYVSEGGDGSKWIEYAPERSSAFTFTPGNVIWVKTRENKKIDLGPGSTLSLKDTFEVDLAPLNWNDISIPYRFDVRLSDILDATGGGADSLLIYSWERDKRSGQYHSQGLYMADFPGLSNRDTILAAERKGYFTIYNPSDKPIRLRVPPRPASSASEAAGLGRARPRSVDWLVAVRPLVAGKGQLPQMYCGASDRLGQGKTERVYPAAISIGSVRAGLVGSSGARAQHMLVSRGAGAGSAFEMSFANTGADIERISIDMVNSYLPDSFSVQVFDPALGTWSENDIGLRSGESVTRWLVVGTAEFARDFKARAENSAFALLGTYIGKGTGQVRIRYSVPFSGVDHLRLRILSIQGRTVWEMEYPGTQPYGIHQVTWSGRDQAGAVVASGLYILRLEAYDRGTKRRYSTRTSLPYAK